MRSAQRGDQRNDEKIDIVYLWVNGADPAWRARRRQAYSNWMARHPEDLAIHGNVSGRYRDNGELLFNLRALERFFPGHGHVYLVTDGQVPAWLRRSDGLTIIDHRDLIPASARPVFDSGHIESYLHHIPGLSERFFYLNDDVFFGARVDTSRWFGQRLTVFTEATPVPHFDTLQPDQTALVNASILSREWLRRRYPGYRHDPHLYSHAPRPMLKSAMHELEALAPELFRKVRSTVFRSWRIPPIVSDLVPRWMVHVGYADRQELDPLHISAGDPQAQAQFDALSADFGHLPFFCINDTCDDAAATDPRLLRIATTLCTLLPAPSSFERIPKMRLPDIDQERTAAADQTAIF